MKKNTIIPFILLFILASCAAPALTPDTVTAKPVDVATETPDAATPEATNTPTSTNTPTAEPTSTPAPQPTDTPTVTATIKPTNTPTVTPTPAPQVRAVGKNVNIRRGPGTAFPVVGVLRAGQSLPVLARGPKGWLQVELHGKPAWIYSGVVEVSGPVETLAMAEDIPTPPPTPTPKAAVATPANPDLPPKQDVVHLTQDTPFPVRANRFIGWGYEIVDASEQWDIVLNRDVFGYVLHEFYGDEFYKEHPHGMRVTFLDCVPKTMKNGVILPCAGTQANVSLLQDRKSLPFGMGDGVGSVLAAGCAIPWTNHYDPQECFIGLGPTDAGFLSDIAIVGMIVGENSIYHTHDGSETPDFRNPPFTPHLGIAVRDDQLQQWRWKNPFLEIVPQQP